MSMPYGDTAGYSYDPEALKRIAGQLGQGSQALDGAMGHAVDTVDAGASSGAVGQALSELMRMATAASGVLDAAADKVHVANGSYGDIENDHSGQLRLNDRKDDDSPTVKTHG